MSLSRQASYNSQTGDYLNDENVSRDYPLISGKKQQCCPTKADGFTVIFMCFVVLTVAITVALVIQIYYGSSQVTPHGAVASDAKECSVAGVKIMHQGGNAVDVAITTLLCTSVVLPHVVGPGGGGVMLIHDHKTNTSTVIDFMSAIPSNRGHTVEQTGPRDPRSIGVPGFLRGLEYAHKKYGKIPWSKLLQPAISLAREGFNVSVSLEDASYRLMDELRQSKTVPQNMKHLLEKTFFPRGLQLTRGTLLIRDTYADFLENVADHGAEAMYTLDYAVEVIETLRSTHDSLVSFPDIHHYHVHERKCLHTQLHNTTIVTAPGPFGGPQMISALHLLDNSDLNKYTPQAQLYHSFMEAERRTYAEYMTLVNTDTENLLNVTKDLLNKMTKEKIDNNVTLSDPSLPQMPDQAAAQVSVIDTFDLYVSAVAGLGSYFGSLVMTKHGILFNNHLTSVLPHWHTNDTHDSTHARPISSYTPVVLADSRQVCGERIVLSSANIGAMNQVVGQVLFRGLDMIESIREPRLTIKPSSNNIFFDDTVKGLKRLPGSVRQELRQPFQVLLPPIGCVNGVSKERNTLMSHSDTRGGGVAARLDGTLSSKPSDTTEPPPPHHTVPHQLKVEPMPTPIS